MSVAAYPDPDAEQLRKLIAKTRREQSARSPGEARAVTVAALRRWKARAVMPRVNAPAGTDGRWARVNIAGSIALPTGSVMKDVLH
jgi:phage baseplate assembly protein W